MKAKGREPTLLLLRPLTLMGLDDGVARNLGLALSLARLAALSLAIVISALLVHAVGIIGFILALKLGRHEPVGASGQEGYMPNGIRVNFFEKERGSKRAVTMLIKKLAGKDFETEYPMPAFDRVEPLPAVKNISGATIALVTSGGIVPKGNPDHIEASSASHYGEYDITGVVDLTADTYETAHGGYDPTYANADSDRVLPVDVLRDLEKEGRIGKLFPTFYTTTGNGTAVASAKKFGAEIGGKLKKAGVDAVILTST